MDNAPVFATSDVHLGAVPDTTARSFHRWLRWATPQASALLINGDLFDFWFEYRSVIPRGYTRTLGLLAEIVDSGVPIHLVGGNHDWWGGGYLTDEIGVQFHHEPFILDLAGHRCLVAHGDGLGRGDLGYRALRKVLRAGLTRWAFRWLHPDVGASVARRVSRTEIRTSGSAQEGRSARDLELERWARDQLLDDDELDLVLLGHSHRPTRVEVAPGRFYINAGDWLHHHSFVVLPRGASAELRGWDGSAPVTIARRGGSPDAST